MDATAIHNVLTGLGVTSFALPVATEVVNMNSVSPDSLATKGTPYVLAVVILALCWALYKVFGLFLSKMQEREDDLKTTLQNNTTAMNRMVDNCVARNLK